MKLLKDKTNAPAPECGPLPVRKTVNILPVISQTAAGRLIQPGQQMEQGALPAAGGAYDGDITPELEHRKSGYVERKRRPYQGNVVRIA